MVNELINFLNKTHSQYHTVTNEKEILLKEGFIELTEDNVWNLESNKKYFVTRGESSLIAFVLPTNLVNDFHYQIIASHSDSPTFKLKAKPIIVENGFVKLNTEKYGGMIYNAWLDRPLTIAGRVMVQSNNKIVSKPFYIDKDLLTIPNVAVHMNKDINSGFTYNPQVDLLPLLGQKEEGKDYLKELFKLGGITELEKVISFDLFLAPRLEASISGLNDEFISSPKLDNLECAFLTLKGLIDSKPCDQVIPVYACFDNEEVGSSSINGAGSTFLDDVLSRISLSFNKTKEEHLVSINKSFVVSSDNAHGLHPNHPEVSDSTNRVELNKGVVIKYNANMKYCSDAFSAGALKLVLESNNIPYQEYENKSNMPGGSTLGNILQDHTSVHVVDIGLAQLAMHSSYEVAGTKDIKTMYDLAVSFFGGNLKLTNDSAEYIK